MRKRIVIGVLAIIVVGVLAFVLSQPKKGTVEWHKREYRRVMDQLHGRSFGQRFGAFRRRLTGEQVYTGLPADISSRFELHKQSLLNAGYLEQRTFRLTNFQGTFQPVYLAAEKVIPEERMRLTVIAGDIRGGTNVVSILCPREDGPVWEDLARKADAP